LQFERGIDTFVYAFGVIAYQSPYSQGVKMKKALVLLLALCVAVSVSLAQQEKAPKAKSEKATTMDCCKPGKDAKASAGCAEMECGDEVKASKDCSPEGKPAMKEKAKGMEKGKVKAKAKEKSKDAKES
jgi:hypothetical protein